MRFTVPGRPVPKERPRRGRNGRFYTPARTRSYEEKVGWAARSAGVRILPGPVSLTARFYLSRCPPGDLDNYLKAVADGLKGIAYRDDRQVVKMAAEVSRCPVGEERVEVEVNSIT